MLLVRIFKYWDYPDLFRQTPNCSGEWNGVKFIIDEPGEADYVIIHGHVDKPVSVSCPKGRVWLVMGEAPHDVAKKWHTVSDFIDRAYTTDSGQSGKKHRLSLAYLPWWVDKTYDYLTAYDPPLKSHDLSWITSNASNYTGHRYRLAFLEKIRHMPELHLFGKGFNPLVDKWHGLEPFRYSIAFENFSNSHYWSEKVMDCFLAWTMPIYFGCTKLSDFFPPESFIQLDPEMDDPMSFIRDAVRSDTRERNMDAIAEARRRVLNDFNLFNLICDEISKEQAQSNGALPKKLRRTIMDHTRLHKINQLPDWLQPTARVLRPIAKRMGI